MGTDSLVPGARPESALLTTKSLIRWTAACLLVLAASGAWALPGDQPDAVDQAAKRGRATVIEYSIPYPNASGAAVESCVSGAAVASGAPSGSTHEITFDRNGGNVLGSPARTTTLWSSSRPTGV